MDDLSRATEQRDTSQAPEVRETNTGGQVVHPPALGTDGAYRTNFLADQDFLLFDSEVGTFLLLIDGSRLHKVSPEIAALLRQASIGKNRSTIEKVLGHLGMTSEVIVGDEPLRNVAPRAFSLAIAQKCNLGCTYCYADQGEFGGPAKNMPEFVALQAVDRLLDGVSEGEHVNLAFMGGEPLVNRKTLQKATTYAAEKAAAQGVTVGFSITTNGTLLKPEDAEFLARYRFSMTVSVDGIRAQHDKLRPFKSGKGSFERLMQRLVPVFAEKRLRPMARVTVTPRNLDLRATLDQLLALGFSNVGFSPMINSPSGKDQLHENDFHQLMNQMLDCAREYEYRALRGEFYAFTNMASALLHIHRGVHQPYACGAGGGYFAVSADGDLSACHRFVGDPAGGMGSIGSGVDLSAQKDWLHDRHVLNQTQCSKCWARFMCGGGCHHEVIHRGRIGCHYIRGWLLHMLGAYSRISAMRPEHFDNLIVYQ